ncbi:tRNA pseudouridine(38-40) synthase TruA [Orenia marismortui]|uniref:tRNA pseudouridine(38-40) synthase TruA n=1 Tax=Orenia marismortui TaxID=46469 RepID=UPI000360C2D2|nr:tRNA pseudouridine(38-40) synthase TruA [Orenia marismortui]
MRNLKCIVAYDGSNYHGFQRQDNAITVQEVIENAIKRLIKQDVKIIGASRTDSKVHARGQVFNFNLDSSIPTERFSLALNTKLPDDVVILDACEMNNNFHARYNTKDKLYKYQIYNNKYPSPFYRNYAYHIYNELDLLKMEEGLKYLIGEHDFTSFRSSGCNAQSPIRKIFDINMEYKEDLIVLNIHGNGFLYNMVRIIVGTLVRVGLGKIRPKEVRDILLSKDRKKAGPTAPAHGLILEKINY